MIEQGSIEWFALRCARLTASSFPDLMARTKSGPSTSRANLIARIAVERLTGVAVDTYSNEAMRRGTYSNEAMRRGTELEPQARAAYEVHAGVMVEECGFFVHPTLDYCGASPDGLVGDDGLLELKCPSAMAKHVDALRRGSHADEYRWQVLGQLWVTGRQWCDVVSFDPRFPDALQVAVKRIDRHEADIERLGLECIAAQEEICALVEELRKIGGLSAK